MPSFAVHEDHFIDFLKLKIKTSYDGKARRYSLGFDNNTRVKADDEIEVKFGPIEKRPRSSAAPGGTRAPNLAASG